MSTISGLGAPILVPSSNSTATNEDNGEAAKANETANGTTEANETDTGNTTGSDSGSSGQNSGGTALSDTQAVSAQTSPTETAIVPSTQSIVLAQIEPPSSAQSEAAARQIAEAAQQAYKQQSILDTLTSGSPKVADLTTLQPQETLQPDSSAEAKGSPV